MRTFRNAQQPTALTSCTKLAVDGAEVSLSVSSLVRYLFGIKREQIDLFHMHGRGIPGQPDVGEQGEGAADGICINLGSAVLGADPSGQQRALQGMERFTLASRR
jgi:hypothetical protein